MYFGKSNQQNPILLNARAKADFSTNCAQPTFIAAPRTPHRATVNDATPHQQLAHCRFLVQLCFQEQLDLDVKM